MQTIPEIEEGMSNVIMHPAYAETLAEYERLLSIMGNVDGNEVVSLVILACWNVSTILNKE